jgi:hypothetical protein
MADVETSEVDEKIAPLNMGTCNFVYWQIFTGRTPFSKTGFLMKQKHESGARLKLKMYILFMETTHEPLRLDKCNLEQNGLHLV